MLAEQEWKLLEMLFDLCPHWKDTITKQIAAADIQRQFTGANMSIIFEIGDVPKLDFNTVDPVEILIGNVDLSNCDFKVVNGCIVISSENLIIPGHETISVLYLFRKGVIEEIEVFSLNGNRLDPVFPLNRPRIYNVKDINSIVQMEKI